ncbi:VOC family protein [Bacillus sp. JJ1764]|uniref:VOC family protein n=1 Tax=Bacillus sp. JJ1764 TaxID=3122964 RepID=UPI002FFF173D
MRIHHFALEVSQLEESVAFYKKNLGFHEEGRILFMGEEIVFLKLGDFRMELISGDRPCVPSTHLCFEVECLSEITGLMNRNRLLEGPYKLENGWETVFYSGPDGEIIEFLQVVTAS